MAKSALPIILAAGAAVLLLGGKKKGSSGSGTTDSSSGSGTTGPGLGSGAPAADIMSGSESGWYWRVKEMPPAAGSNTRYVSEVKKGVGGRWVSRRKISSSPEEAKAVALEYISTQFVGPIKP